MKTDVIFKKFPAREGSGAMKAAAKVYDNIDARSGGDAWLGGCADDIQQGMRDKWTAIIDREAVLPAVRELVRALRAYKHAWAAEEFAERAIIQPDSPPDELRTLYNDADELLEKAKLRGESVLAKWEGKL
jgi:hypothetical protein